MAETPSTSDHAETANEASESATGGEMTNVESSSQDTDEGVLTEERAADENTKLVYHMRNILQDSRHEAARLRLKLAWTYWIIITLSVLMFLVGLALISSPLWWAQASGDNLLKTFGAAGLGALDLIGLFLFRPIATIEKLMGDMSQLTVVFDSFQVQVALRLIETNSKKRETMGTAAEHVQTAAEETLRLIEERYEKWLLDELKRSGPWGRDSDGGAAESDVPT